MTTQNWPDPKRPGVPLFPERDGWHNFVGHHVPCAEEDDTDSPELSPTYLYCCWWDSEGQAWSGFDEAPWDLEECADSLADMEYYGPVLTPTQLTELLAGERERCAKLCEEAYEKSGRDFEYLGCNDAASQIRNLGAAS